MIIQRILPPGDNHFELYIRELDDNRREKEIKESFKFKERITITFPIRLKRRHVYSLGTFVNALAIDNWVRNTSIKNITVVIRTTGDVNIQMYNSVGGYSWGDELRAAGKYPVEADVFCERHSNYCEYIIELRDISYRGIIFPIIEAREDCELLGGEYTTNTPTGASKVRPVAIVNYNKDAIAMQHTIVNIRQFRDLPIPIVVCDMTGKLPTHFFANRGVNSNSIRQIATSHKTGRSINRALDYLDIDNKTAYTHAIIIDSGVELRPEGIERLIAFLTLIDDFRSDAIIQGDVLRKGSVIEGTGGIVRGNRPYARFFGFDVRHTPDVVAMLGMEDIDYFRFGVMCMPLIAHRRFNPDLVKCVEFDYYLRYKPLNVITLNGLIGMRDNMYDEGIVKEYYYGLRDEMIAKVDTDLEVGKTAFREHVAEAFKREVKRGNIELADAIIDAVNDFMWGPTIFSNEETIEARLDALTKRHNDNIIGRKKKFRDSIKLEQAYSKMYLQIDANYDMIVDRWRDAKLSRR